MKRVYPVFLLFLSCGCIFGGGDGGPVVNGTTSSSTTSIDWIGFYEGMGHELPPMVRRSISDGVNYSLDDASHHKVWKDERLSYLGYDVDYIGHPEIAINEAVMPRNMPGGFVLGSPVYITIKGSVNHIEVRLRYSEASLPVPARYFRGYLWSEGLGDWVLARSGVDEENKMIWAKVEADGLLVFWGRGLPDIRVSTGMKDVKVDRMDPLHLSYLVSNEGVGDALNLTVRIRLLNRDNDFIPVFEEAYDIPANSSVPVSPRVDNPGPGRYLVDVVVEPSGDLLGNPALPNPVELYVTRKY